MFVNLKFGLADVIKNKVFFIVCTAFITLLGVVIMLITMSLRIDTMREEFMKGQRVEAFEPVYTQYDFPYDSKDIARIAEFYQENSVATRFSNSLSEIYGRPVYLVFGDGSLVNEDIVNHNGVSVYAYSIEKLDCLTILSADHVIQPVTYTGRYKNDYTGEDPFSETDSVFVVYQGREMVELIIDLSKDAPTFLYELIGNTWVLKEDIERINGFREYVVKHMAGISFKDNFYSQSQSNGFLHYYLTPLIIVLLATGILSFFLIFQGMLEKMRRNLTIHILSGARFMDVLSRFYAFYGLIVVASLLLLWSTGTIVPEVKGAIVMMYLIITVCLSVYLIRALKKTNLFENLRGDMA